MSECRADHGGEQFFVAHPDFSGGQRDHAHDGGIHLGRGAERLRRHIEQLFHLEAVLQHHRQPPVFRRGVPGNHALDHFILQHEVHVLDALGVGGEVEQQRRGDVVRQVADDAQRGGQRREIEFQRVSGMDDQFRSRIILRVVMLQPRDDVAVDFHHMQMIQSLQQRTGQRAQAGADLDHIVGWFRANRADDIGDDLLIDQEILAETFLCAMIHAAALHSNGQIIR